LADFHYGNPLSVREAGLFPVYLICSCRVRHFPNLTLTGKLIFFVVLYLLLLFDFHFRNIASANSAGRPLVNCIHLPGWMQAAYLLNGPLYFLICEFSGFAGTNLPMRAALPG